GARGAQPLLLGQRLLVGDLEVDGAQDLALAVEALDARGLERVDRLLGLAPRTMGLQVDLDGLLALLGHHAQRRGLGRLLEEGLQAHSCTLMTGPVVPAAPAAPAVPAPPAPSPDVAPPAPSAPPAAPAPPVVV